MPDIEKVKKALNCRYFNREINDCDNCDYVIKLGNGEATACSFIPLCGDALKVIEEMEKTINDIDAYARDLQKAVKEYEAIKRAYSRSAD